LVGRERLHLVRGAGERSDGEGMLAAVRMRFAQGVGKDRVLPFTLLGLAMTGNDIGTPRVEGEPPKRGRWRQSDVKRVIAAAGQAGLDDYRIEIAPDGMISIVVGDSSATRTVEE